MGVFRPVNFTPGHNPDLYHQHVQTEIPPTETFVHQSDPGVLYAEELSRRVVMEHRLYNQATDLVRTILQRDRQISTLDDAAIHATSRAARDGQDFRGHASVELLTIIELDDIIRQITLFGPPTRDQCDHLRQRVHQAKADIMRDQDQWTRYA